MRKRAVITGMGAVTPIGTDAAAMWDNIKNGACGIKEIESFDTTEFKVKIAAEVKDFDPLLYMTKKEAKRHDRFCQFAAAASQMAVEDSGIDTENEDHDRIGVIIGSGVGGITTIERELATMRERGPSGVSPFFIPMMISNMASGLVAIKFKAMGINYGTVAACASGAAAIGEALRKIQDGTCDAVIAGGADATITPASVAGFTSLSALCETNDILQSSIPFDKERSGFVMGEGAGVVVIEEYERALKRGARIYAEVVGYGANCDAYHITSPEPTGAGSSKCMELAMQDAGIGPQDIGYINAHGTSTQYNDRIETLAIKKVFGEQAYNIPVSSTKSMTGHMIGAAGAVEAIICVKSLLEGYIPPTIGYKTPDEDCDLDYVPNVGRAKSYTYALSNSLGFGGHNVTLILKKIEELS